MPTGWVLDRYLDRLQIDRVGPAGAPALRRLHRHHLDHIPFENLSIHLGEPIVLDQVELVAKVAVRRRGGFCYELNGALAWLLRSLGYRVDLLEAAVFRPDGAPGPHFDHMVLIVHLEQTWLVDVGFGESHAEPLPLQPGVDHVDPNGIFRLVEQQDADSLALWRDGTPQYRLSLRPYPLSAFGEMCRFHQTSPASHFTRNTICSLPVPRGRVTLTGRTLIVTRDGERDERDLDDTELLASYRDIFGLDLPRLPELGSG